MNTKFAKACVLLAVFLMGGSMTASAEIQIIDGVKYECSDGMCRRVEEPTASTASEDAAPASALAVTAAPSVRLAQGFMDADAFLAFLKGAEPAALPTSVWLLVLTLLAAGVAMNLTPCVLPMIPVNLIVIGQSARRGLLYGVGIAVAYGLLGVFAAVGSLAFGTIQSSPLFNAFVALVFAALGLSLCGVFSIDLTRFRTASGVRAPLRGSALFPLFMGALSAVLAGACVAPILISVLLLTADLYARGQTAALALPFVLGLGMALPWPFLGAGLRVLPKPGAWMKTVNRVFAVIVFGFAVWYGRLAVRGLGGAALPEPEADEMSDVATLAATPVLFGPLFATLDPKEKPILVDCWATWCKNCTAMERGTLRDPKVVEALRGYTVIRLQAEDLSELKRLPGFAAVQGLPAFVLFE